MRTATRLIIALLSVTTMGFEPHLPRCKGVTLPPSVDARLRPVLEALESASARDDWFDKTYEERFYALIQAADATAKEAKVALMAYYVGEAMGEDLVCAVEKDGHQMLPLLERYRRCRPGTSLEPIPSRLLIGPVLYDYALQGIRKGETCESEE